MKYILYFFLSRILMRIVYLLFMIVIFSFPNKSILLAVELVCSFEGLITADGEEIKDDVSYYLQMKEIRSKSKFVFDIEENFLVVNGEEYQNIYETNDGNLSSCSNKRLPYVMFHYYRVYSKIIIVGMQDVRGNTFLRSEVLNCGGSPTPAPTPKPKSIVAPVVEPIPEPKKEPEETVTEIIIPPPGLGL